MKSVQAIGIIGLGDFGQFVASHIPRDNGLKIYGHDIHAKTIKDIEIVDLPAIVTCDILIIAIPLEAYPKLLVYLHNHIKSETLLIDICSVKVYPEQYFKTYLPEYPNLLLTHPLFGPQSTSNGIAGHTLIVTVQKGELAAKAIHYGENILGLKIRHMTSEEHDKHMAYVHALTFFVARGLSNLQVESEKSLMTPSYQMIKDLVAFDKTHSEALFQTIQDGNPYAAELRRQVVNGFTNLESSLSREKSDE